MAARDTGQSHTKQPLQATNPAPVRKVLSHFRSLELTLPGQFVSSLAPTESKVYLVLHGCSVNKAVHLDLLKSLEVQELIPSLKRFIARRGRPETINSDNVATFKVAAKWLQKVQRMSSFTSF